MTPSPHSLLRVARLATAAVLVFTLPLSACSGDDAAAEQPQRGADRPPPGVRIITAESRTFEQKVAFTGELVAQDMVDLAPERAGRLSSLAVDEGDTVEAGDVIGTVDVDVLRRQRAEAATRVDSARARVDQAEAQLAQANNEVSRRAPLVEREAFPAAELARLEDDAAVAEQAVALAVAQQAEAEAAVNAIRAELEQAEIVAPFAGLVVERHVTAGAMVSAQSPVVTLVDPTSLRFVFRLAESRLDTLRPGSTATLRLDAYGDTPIEATVSWVGRTVDRASRTVEVRLQLPPDDRVLRHGMFGRGTLTTNRLDGATVVPVSALQQTLDDSLRVWEIDAEDIARPRPITVVMRDEDYAAIDGVSPGARIVVSPPMNLAPDSPVYVVGEESSP